MSSKTKRRPARGIPGYRPGERAPLTAQQIAAVMLDGIDCPYCSRRVLDNGHGLFACECGWSGGVVFTPCADPSCTVGH
jgi:ribosomal protein L37AE/L43A